MPDGRIESRSAQSATAIKPSRYTVLVPMTGGRYLAYNTVSQSFSVWDGEDMALWNDLEMQGALGYRAA